MKKKTLLLATVFAATSTFAQDLTSKKGEPFLPEAGDWAITWDAKPVLDYFGMLLSNGGATSPVMNSSNGMPFAIRGKMFKDEKTAYRASLRLGFGSDTWTANIAQQGVTTPPTYPTAPAMVEDELKSGSTNIVLGGGLEMRRGKTRLQGFYGGELLIGSWGTKDSYTYGNTLDNTNNNPNANSTDWSAATGYNNIIANPNGYPVTERITEVKNSTLGIGIRGFIGAEYFIFPKISVGAEYGWGLGFMSSKFSQTSEGNDGTNGGTTTIESKSSGFAIDADINNGMFGGTGNLLLTLHF